MLYYASLIVLGNALTCQKCGYTSKYPKENQTCDPNNIVNCTSGSGYCGTVKLTDKNGTVHVGRGCDGIGSSKAICPVTEKFCIELSKKEGLQACAVACCQTDNCNNFDPSSSATGIMVTKFTLILMVIAGLVA